MTLIMVCVKDFATPHMRSLLRRFDRQSNGQHAVLLPVAQGEVWSRYLAVKLPRTRPVITNSIVYDYCSSIVRAGSNSAVLNKVLGSWMSKYGEAAVASKDGTSSGGMVALSNCECDVSLINSEIQEGVMLATSPGGILPDVGMTAYRPLVVRARSGEIRSWGVSSELRLTRRERGYIVQYVTEVILPSRERGVAVVRKYTQAWKVSRRPKSKLIVAGQGKCEFSFTSHDLERKGGRMYRLRAFFVAGAAGIFTWEKTKRGVSWSPGHVLQPLRGQQVLCRLVNMKWGPARMPLFWGNAFVSSVLGRKLLVEAKVESAVVAGGTRSGRAKNDRPSQEPQGADLCRAAGLGASVRGHLGQPRKRNERASLVLNSELEGEGETGVVGDRLGRKLTGAMAARGHDALAECTRCALRVPISDALVCVFREKDIVFTDGQSGGHCGLVLCTDCFNEDIDEEQYPDWRDEPQSLLTAAHARLVYNFVCPQCRYDICCNRVVPPRDDVQYRYLISLITQYLVDVTSHLARSTVGSYGQHINVFMDFFAAAPELDSDLCIVFGAAEVDLVVVANCTMLGMLMLHRANEGLTYNGIRGLRSAVWKSWSTRSESPPTDQPRATSLSSRIS
jgi:hypothetical protein